MTHGDDDGLRLPPAIAPRQIVVVPMLRDKPEDAEVLAYCEDLVTALNQPDAPSASRCARCWTPRRSSRRKSAGTGCAAARRSSWRSARAMPPAGNVTYMRRDDLRDGDKVKSIAKPRADFLEKRGAAAGRDPGRALCRGQGAAGRQYQDAASPTGRAWRTISPAAMTSFKGWLRVAWSKPTRRGAGSGGQQAEGPEAHHPQRAAADQPAEFAPCLFTGKPGVEEILIGRAY